MNATELHAKMMKMSGGLVVGSYTDEGAVKEESVITGTQEDIEKLEKAACENAKVTDKNIQLKSKKKTGKKVISNNQNQILPSAIDQLFVEKSKSEFVHFFTGFGTIKLKIEDAYLCEESGIGLVFKHEDDINFVPKTGDVLEIRLRNNMYKVMYPDIVFDLPDGNKKLIILMIVNNEE